MKTVDDCLKMFWRSGISEFLPSAVAAAAGLDQDLVCARLRELLQQGRLGVRQKALCPVCTHCLGVFEEELPVPAVLFCCHCRQNRAAVMAPLFFFSDPAAADSPEQDES